MTRDRRRATSLVENKIVLAVIVVLAAIAVPLFLRFTRGAAGNRSSLTVPVLGAKSPWRWICRDTRAGS